MLVMLILWLEIEWLVELVFDCLVDDVFVCVVDLGIGSGVIVLLIGMEWLCVWIMVIDVSIEVLVVV